MNSQPLHWLSPEAPEHDVVISSRLRLARNLATHTFPQRARPPARDNTYRVLREALSGELSGWRIFECEPSTPSEAEVLREQRLISTLLTEREGPRGAFISPDGRFSIMLNEEDHLRIQLLEPGLSLRTSWEEVSRLEDRLAQRLPFAFHPRYGYLTSCLTNLGTGLRASVLLHLPALHWFNALPNLIKQVTGVGLTIRGAYGEGSRPEGLFMQLSNQVTLGLSEQELLSRVESVVMHLVASERLARKNLLGAYSRQFADSVWRALGLAANARLMELGEAVEHLSTIRVGALLGLLDRVQAHEVTRLLVSCRSGHLELRAGRPLSPLEHDEARADFLRQAVREWQEGPLTRVR